jgi:hypothetical protein
MYPSTSNPFNESEAILIISSISKLLDLLAYHKLTLPAASYESELAPKIACCDKTTEHAAKPVNCRQFD